MEESQQHRPTHQPTQLLSTTTAFRVNVLPSHLTTPSPTPLLLVVVLHHLLTTRLHPHSVPSLEGSAVTVEVMEEQVSRRQQQQQPLQQQQDIHQHHRTTTSLILLETLELRRSHRLLDHWAPRRQCCRWHLLCRRRQAFRPLSLSVSRCIGPRATADRTHSISSITSRITTLVRSSILLISLH